MKIKNKNGVEYEIYPRADLRCMDFRKSYLCESDFSGIDLIRANLRWANFRESYLTEMSISDTCWVYGWRVEKSVTSGRTYYILGKHTAPYFSTSNTKRNPGLYLSSREWLEKNYPRRRIVRVRCRRKNLHKAGDKWRCRKLEVLG